MTKTWKITPLIPVVVMARLARSTAMNKDISGFTSVDTECRIFYLFIGNLLEVERSEVKRGRSS